MKRTGTPHFKKNQKVKTGTLEGGQLWVIYNMKIFIMDTLTTHNSNIPNSIESIETQVHFTFLEQVHNWLWSLLVRLCTKWLPFLVTQACSHSLEHMEAQSNFLVLDDP